MTACDAIIKSRGAGKPVGMSDKEVATMCSEALEHSKLLSKMLTTAHTHK